MQRITIVAAGLALTATALVIPAATYAQPFTVEADLDRRVEYVSYADLNIGSSKGLANLQSRIRGAAKRVCIEHGVMGVKPRLQERACFNEAMSGAEQQIKTVLAALDRGEQFASNAGVAVRGASL
jgi:UrcA family protein